jgi:hypothetical protein
LAEPVDDGASGLLVPPGEEAVVREYSILLQKLRHGTEEAVSDAPGEAWPAVRRGCCEA